ncbi:iron-hydroxamate ABC transporter substrate-binding protein [Ornithinibacillus halophilus]|uniref:Iron complex transport system substrate-binding protein n=1 Tax=Ornithinibacillus halophilus TaxID=930117 RepID=A0A1M5K815_9BACI|nr:iron-hydroxamate ABC transporter substrate-binding protein [Ornithinibacillus halophilus]SHG48720.1 iron complex transport system substrate-binding protein [Ornithinibacillus halophilus]
MSKIVRNSVLLTMLTVIVLFISACGNEDTPENNDTQNNGDNNTSPEEVTLESEMGKVTIPTTSERVLAPYHEDALLALGVTPVAKWAIGQMVQDYLEKDLSDVPKIEWNMPMEQVLSHEPDLIILENGLDSYEGTYDDYNKIADTYVMTAETTANWKKQIEVFGKLLGKEDEAEKVLSDYDEKVADAKKQILEALGDETVAAIWVAGDQFYIFEENRHSAEVFYSELGMNVPELVKNLGEADVQWNPISIEKLSELDADHVFLLALEGEQGLETLENSSVWKSTPAFKNDNIYILNDPSNWTNKGIIASKKTIDDILSVIVE